MSEGEQCGGGKGSRNTGHEGSGSLQDSEFNVCGAEHIGLDELTVAAAACRIDAKKGTARPDNDFLVLLKVEVLGVGSHELSLVDALDALASEGVVGGCRVRRAVREIFVVVSKRVGPVGTGTAVDCLRSDAVFVFDSSEDAIEFGLSAVVVTVFGGLRPQLRVLGAAYELAYGGVLGDRFLVSVGVVLGRECQFKSDLVRCLDRSGQHVLESQVLDSFVFIKGRVVLKFPHDIFVVVDFSFN